MTETQNPPSQQSAAEEEIAAAIALVLAGRAAQGADPAVVIAALLKLLPGLPETDADVSAPVSRLVVGAIPSEAERGRGDAEIRASRPQERGRGEAEIRASRANLSYRAHYAIEAVKRIAGKVNSGESIGDAFSGERRHFRAHLEASADRVAGAALNDAAASRWGPLLSWNDTGRATTHRPSHLAANGANYRVDAPPAATEGMLPGMARHCDCVPGPPIQGARTLR